MYKLYIRDHSVLVIITISIKINCQPERGHVLPFRSQETFHEESCGLARNVSESSHKLSGKKNDISSRNCGEGSELTLRTVKQVPGTDRRARDEI